MYEHYIAATPNGVTDIEFEIETDNVPTPNTNTDGYPGAAKVTVTFAVTTDSEAWMTIDSDGFVYPSFGGTGVIDEELDSYAEHTVRIWRAISGDDETTCRYKTTDDTTDSPDNKHTIDA